MGRGVLIKLGEEYGYNNPKEFYYFKLEEIEESGWCPLVDSSYLDERWSAYLIEIYYSPPGPPYRSNLCGARTIRDQESRRYITNLYTNCIYKESLPTENTQIKASIIKRSTPMSEDLMMPLDHVDSFIRHYPQLLPILLTCESQDSFINSCIYLIHLCKKEEVHNILFLGDKIGTKNFLLNSLLNLSDLRPDRFKRDNTYFVEDLLVSIIKYTVPGSKVQIGAFPSVDGNFINLPVWDNNTADSPLLNRTLLDKEAFRFTTLYQQKLEQLSVGDSIILSLDLVGKKSGLSGLKRLLKDLGLDYYISYIKEEDNYTSVVISLNRKDLNFYCEENTVYNKEEIRLLFRYINSSTPKNLIRSQVDIIRLLILIPELRKKIKVLSLINPDCYIVVNSDSRDYLKTFFNAHFSRSADSDSINIKLKDESWFKREDTPTFLNGEQQSDFVCPPMEALVSIVGGAGMWDLSFSNLINRIREIRINNEREFINLINYYYCLVRLYNIISDIIYPDINACVS